MKPLFSCFLPAPCMEKCSIVIDDLGPGEEEGEEETEEKAWEEKAWLEAGTEIRVSL